MTTCKLQLFKYFIFKSKGRTYDFIINCVYFLNGNMRLQVQQSIILDEYKRAVLNFANSPFNYMAWFVFPQSISSSFSCFFSNILILISNLGTFKLDISWSLHIKFWLLIYWILIFKIKNSSKSNEIWKDLYLLYRNFEFSTMFSSVGKQWN